MGDKSYYLSEFLPLKRKGDYIIYMEFIDFNAVASAKALQNSGWPCLKALREDSGEN